MAGWLLYEGCKQFNKTWPCEVLSEDVRGQIGLLLRFSSESSIEEFFELQLRGDY